MAGGIISSLMYSVGFKFNPRGLDQGDKKIKGLTANVAKFGIAAGAAFGAAAIGIGVAALNAAGEYENAMTQIQNATGATAEQMEATRGIAQNLYSQNFGEDWADLGDSITSVQQITGMAGTALEGATKNALGLRKTFGFEVSESIRTVDTMMKNFGVTSDQAFNLIAQGKQKGLDFSGEMLDSINEYSNQFVSLGFNANQMFDTLAAGAASGAFNLDKVGDAVKEFNLRASDGSKTTVEAYKSLGMDASKMMQTFAAGGPEAQKSFSQVVQSISKIKDPVQANIVATSLFGTQFEDLQDNVLAAMGTAQNQFDMTKDSMSQINKIKFTSFGQVLGFMGRQIEVGFLIPLGQKLLPYMDKFGQWISDHQPQITAFGAAVGDKIGGAIERVSHWVQIALPYVQQFGGWIGDMFSVASAKAAELWDKLQPVAVSIGQDLLGAAQSLWPEIQKIGSTIADVATSFAKWEGFAPLVSGIAAALLTYKAVIGTITLATKIASAATKAWTAIQAAFNVVMSLNPIGIVIAALVGLGVALVVAYKRSENFRAFVDGMWKGIKSVTMGVLNFIRVTIPKYFMIGFNAVTGFLKRWGIVLLGALGGPVTLAAALIYKYWDQIKAVTVAVFTGIWNWLKSAWTWIKDTVSGAASGIWNAVTGAWNKVKSTTSNLLTQVWNKIKEIWNGIVSSIKNTGTRLFTAVTEMWGKVKGFFQGINLLEIGKNIIQGLIDGVGSMAEALKKKVSDVANGIAAKVKDVLGIHSPSRVMMEMGFYTGEGLARGIEQTTPRVGIASDQMAGAVIDRTSDSVQGEYTPDAAPARVTNNRQSVAVNPVFNFTIQGNMDEKSARSAEAIIEEKFVAFIESWMRSAGLDGA